MASASILLTVLLCLSVGSKRLDGGGNRQTATVIHQLTSIHPLSLIHSSILSKEFLQKHNQRLDHTH